MITLNDVEVFNGVAESLGFDSDARDQLRQLVDGRNVADLESFLTSRASVEDCRALPQLIRLSGKFETLDRMGRLMLRLPAGNLEAITVGEVFAPARAGVNNG